MAQTNPVVERDGTAPPYMPFRTLTNLLVRMESEGVPRTLDRGYLEKMSGATMSQLIAGMRWLGLVDGEERPTARLKELVEARADRPAEFAKLLRAHYEWAIALGDENATQGDLDEAFKRHGVSGATVEKAVGFYLAAARYATVTVSPFFKQPRGAGTSSSTRRRIPRPARRTQREPKQPEVEREPEVRRQSHHGPALPDGLDPAIVAWLQRIPAGQKWPTEERARWETTLKAIFDGVFVAK